MKKTAWWVSLLLRLCGTVIVAIPFAYFWNRYFDQDWGWLLFPIFAFFEGFVIACPDRYQWKTSEYRVFSRGRTIFYLFCLAFLIFGFIVCCMGNWGPAMLCIYAVLFLLPPALMSMLFGCVFSLCFRQDRKTKNQ